MTLLYQGASLYPQWKGLFKKKHPLHRTPILNLHAIEGWLYHPPTSLSADHRYSRGVRSRMLVMVICEVLSCFSLMGFVTQFYDLALHDDQFAHNYTLKVIFSITVSSMIYFGIFHPVLLGSSIISTLFLYALRGCYEEMTGRTKEAIRGITTLTTARASAQAIPMTLEERKNCELCKCSSTVRAYTHCIQFTFSPQLERHASLACLFQARSDKRHDRRLLLPKSQKNSCGSAWYCVICSLKWMKFWHQWSWLKFLSPLLLVRTKDNVQQCCIAISLCNSNMWIILV